MDAYADPRTRSKRGRGRGRGRGARGSRARGRGHGRTSAGRQPSHAQRKAEELGSNEYRFQERNEEDAEDFDAGADFAEEAASTMTIDPLYNELKEDKSLPEFSVDLGPLEKALESVPLWLRLGEVSRFALGVADDDVLENYLEPFDLEDVVDPRDIPYEDDDVDGGQQGSARQEGGERQDENDVTEEIGALNLNEADDGRRGSAKATLGEDFARALDDLDFNDHGDQGDGCTAGERGLVKREQAQVTGSSSDKEAVVRDGSAHDDTPSALGRKGVAEKVPKADDNEFDQWLDSV